MLEGVTLGELVELVVEVLVDLALLSVLGEQSSDDSLSSHPEDLLGHSSVGGTLSLTETGVSAGSLGLSKSSSSRSRVHGVRLSDNKAVGDELSDLLSGVSVSNVGELSGVEPDLSLSNAEDAGGESLSGLEVGPDVSTCFGMVAKKSRAQRWISKLVPSLKSQPQKRAEKRGSRQTSGEVSETCATTQASAFAGSCWWFSVAVVPHVLRSVYNPDSPCPGSRWSP